MKGYRVAEARARFGALLDEAEEGEVVFIERHGIRFTLMAENLPTKPNGPVSTITWAHPAVRAGQWTWEDGSNGPEFVDTRPGVKPLAPKRKKSRR